jgi:hypothetical protein
MKSEEKLIREAAKHAAKRPIGSRGPLPSSPGLGFTGAAAGGIVSAGTKAAEAAPGVAQVGILSTNKAAVINDLINDGLRCPL